MQADRQIQIRFRRWSWTSRLKYRFSTDGDTAQSPRPPYRLASHPLERTLDSLPPRAEEARRALVKLSQFDEPVERFELDPSSQFFRQPSSPRCELVRRLCTKFKDHAGEATRRHPTESATARLESERRKFGRVPREPGWRRIWLHLGRRVSYLGTAVSRRRNDRFSDWIWVECGSSSGRQRYADCGPACRQPDSSGCQEETRSWRHDPRSEEGMIVPTVSFSRFALSTMFPFLSLAPIAYP